MALASPQKLLVIRGAAMLQVRLLFMCFPHQFYFPLGTASFAEPTSFAKGTYFSLDLVLHFSLLTNVFPFLLPSLEATSNCVSEIAILNICKQGHLVYIE